MACYGCCNNVKEIARLHADGEDITDKIDHVSVVCVNISSYGAGLDLWSDPSASVAAAAAAADATAAAADWLLLQGSAVQTVTRPSTRQELSTRREA